jgi:branched-chain amino acid transport system permease protein
MIKLRGLLPIVFIGLLLIVPLLPIGTDSNLTLLISMFIVAGLAASWNILAGFAGQINLGHAAFFGIGSLVMRQLWLGDVPFVLSFIAAGLAAALAALVIGIPALRLKGIYFSIGTLALAQALQITIETTIPRISRLPAPMLREYELAPRYYLALGVLVVIVVVAYWLSRSKLGLGMMAAREDEAAARSIGINVMLHRLVAFVLSAAFAGFTGGVFAYYQVSYYHSYAFTPLWTFDALLVTFVGGIGTLLGPLLGSAFYVLMRDILASALVNFHLAVFGIIFVLVVLLLPGGIIELSSILRRRFSQSTIVSKNTQ